MTGFEWLNDLPEEQQRRLYMLMQAVADGDNEIADALAPPLLDEALANDQAWVEVFVKNFHLRSLVFNREDVREALPQAVALLERAHREDAAGCPQAVCTTHVLTAAYTLTDPVGYAEKREAVSRETLEGLDPERVCFVCISNEVATAMIDQGRAEEALAFIAGQKEIRRERGIDLDPDDFAMVEAEALLAVERHDEALDAITAGIDAGVEYRGESWMKEARHQRAWILAESGRGAEAAEQLPPLEQIFRDGGFETHRRFVQRLVTSGAIEPLPGAVRLVHLAAQALERGLADTGIQASIRAAEWLHAGGHPLLAEAVIERALPHQSSLVDASRFEAELSAKRPDGPVAEESIAHALQGEASGKGAVGIASRWRQMGFTDRADAVLEEATEAFPNDIGLYEARCTQAIRSRDAELLESLIQSFPDHPEGQDNAWFYEGIFAHETGDEERAIRAFEAVWARRQDWGEVPTRLGKLLLTRDPSRSLAVFEAAAEAFDGPYFSWMSMVAATIAQDWPAQARIGRALELPELPDDARAEMDWGYVRIRFPGEGRRYLAQRTGPVTARILTLCPPDEAQRHGEVVVFDPQINNADEVEEDDEALRGHDAWTRIEAPTKDCVTIDGIWSSDEAVEAFSAALDAADVYHQRAAGEGYEITDPDDGSTHRGLFYFLAVNDETAPALRMLLEAHRPESGPWIFHELLDRMDEGDEAETHRALARAWGMI